jgi:hypothetical protein
MSRAEKEKRTIVFRKRTLNPTWVERVTSLMLVG